MPATPRQNEANNTLPGAEDYQITSLGPARYPENTLQHAAAVVRWSVIAVPRARSLLFAIRGWVQ
jgi:hypothetical protein